MPQLFGYILFAEYDRFLPFLVSLPSPQAVHRNWK
jgi:hypothetical protein